MSCPQILSVNCVLMVTSLCHHALNGTYVSVGGALDTYESAWRDRVFILANPINAVVLPMRED